MKIDEFERVLDKQDKLEIQDAAKELKEFFNEIEEI